MIGDDPDGRTCQDKSTFSPKGLTSATIIVSASRAVSLPCAENSGVKPVLPSRVFPVAPEAGIDDKTVAIDPQDIIPVF